MRPVLTIAGGGMGDTSLLTVAAREAVAKAERLYAPARIADNIRQINPAVRFASTSQIQRELEETVGDATVVVSGDVCFFSLSDTLTRAVGNLYEIRTINGISSMQYLCGRVGKPYQNIKILSLHGRTGSLLGAVSYNSRTFVLTGGENTVSRLSEALVNAGLGYLDVTVGENLSAPDERIVTSTANELAGADFPGIAVMLVENSQPADASHRLRDEDFIRTKVPMTKEAVRTVSVARLDISPTDTVWDIGAGTGSVSVALAYAACDGMVYAVERNPEALSLIRQNMAKLGAHNIITVDAEAPHGLEELPPPDRVFVGGSGGNMRKILEHINGYGRQYRACINAITLESVSSALDCMDNLGFEDVEVSCLNTSIARKVGGYHMMTAQNPVHIISGEYRT